MKNHQIRMSAAVVVLGEMTTGQRHPHSHERATHGDVQSRHQRAIDYPGEAFEHAGTALGDEDPTAALDQTKEANTMLEAQMIAPK